MPTAHSPTKNKLLVGNTSGSTNWSPSKFGSRSKTINLMTNNLTSSEINTELTNKDN